MPFLPARVLPCTPHPVLQPMSLPAAHPLSCLDSVPHGGPPTPLPPPQCMVTKCGGQIFRCVTDTSCKAALDCLQTCEFNDQVGGGARKGGATGSTTRLGPSKSGGHRLAAGREGVTGWQLIPLPTLNQIRSGLQIGQSNSRGGVRALDVQGAHYDPRSALLRAH